MSEHLLDRIRNDIKGAKPVAPAELRERVRDLGTVPPAREPLLARLTQRRFLLAVPTTLVVALLAAGVLANLPRDRASQTAASGGAASTAVAEAGKARESAPSLPAAEPLQGNADSAIVPSPGRLQRVDAEMRLRVEGLEELSTATKRAMRIAQSLGGYVASVQYDAPAEGIGGANLVLRVPTPRIQTAIAQLSALGTILGQRIGIEDLQTSVNDLADQVAETQRRIAQLRKQLASTSLVDEERAVLQARLTEERRQLADLQTAVRGTRAEGALATVQVSLTTEALAPATKDEGRLDRLGEILAWEGTALLYVLALAGPFVLLAVIVWLVLRFRRRRQETQLLEQH